MRTYAKETAGNAGRGAALGDGETLLPAVVTAVQAAGAELCSRFSPDTRPRDGEELLAAIDANDAASLAILRPLLDHLRPGAGWAEEESGGSLLARGEWWVADPVEGNINHIHGLTGWGVTATLVRDNLPVLTAVHLPLGGHTYTAVASGGAYRDGLPLRVSAKTQLGAALVGTGQAKPGEDATTYRRIGDSVTAMLTAALLVDVSVPATLPLIQVAAGQLDLFWQHSSVRSGLLAGALLVAEAGGTVSDLHGRPWTLTSEDFLASAPGLHAAAIDVLSNIH